MRAFATMTASPIVASATLISSADPRRYPARTATKAPQANSSAVFRPSPTAVTPYASQPASPAQSSGRTVGRTAAITGHSFHTTRAMTRHRWAAEPC